MRCCVMLKDMQENIVEDGIWASEAGELLGINRKYIRTLVNEQAIGQSVSKGDIEFLKRLAKMQKNVALIKPLVSTVHSTRRKDLVDTAELNKYELFLYNRFKESRENRSMTRRNIVVSDMIGQFEQGLCKGLSREGFDDFTVKLNENKRPRQLSLLPKEKGAKCVKGPSKKFVHLGPITFDAEENRYMSFILIAEKMREKVHHDLAKVKKIEKVAHVADITSFTLEELMAEMKRRLSAGPNQAFAGSLSR